MKFCPYCGNQLLDESACCNVCGKSQAQPMQQYPQMILRSFLSFTEKHCLLVLVLLLVGVMVVGAIVFSSSNLPTSKDTPKVYLAIDSYHYSLTTDYGSSASGGKRYLYVDITLSNPINETHYVEISTNPLYFKLYTTDNLVYGFSGYEDNGFPAIVAGGQCSWYIYFEIPNTATPYKLVYNYGDASAEATFS